MSISVPEVRNISINNHSDFFRIKRVPFEQTAKKYRLKDVFTAVIDFTPLTLGTNDMKSILLEDLHINDINLRQPLLNVLEGTVLHYLKTWDGWKLPVGSYKRDFEFQVAFIKLCHYLTLKCNFVIRHAKEYIQELSKSSTYNSQAGTLSNTDCVYKVVIGGPPSILNTIVALIRDDDIVVRQHAEHSWTTVTLKEFLNWPYVSVEVKLLDLHLKRVNSHKFQRYIAKTNQKISFSENEFISKVTKFSEDAKPYTHTFFRFYFIQLFNVLQKLEGVNATRVKELQEVYTQFLDDVKEMNIANGSMCTDTAVSFQIGNQKYARSKFISKKDEKNEKESINFIEHILPHVDLTLFYCTAVQDMSDTTGVTFKRLNAVIKRGIKSSDHDIQNLMFVVNNTCVEYACTFCYKKFIGSQALKEVIGHFAHEHKVGHPVVCFKCHKQFQVKSLAGDRWKHACI